MLLREEKRLRVQVTLRPLTLMLLFVAFLPIAASANPAISIKAEECTKLSGPIVAGSAFVCKVDVEPASMAVTIYASSPAIEAREPEEAQGQRTLTFRARKNIAPGRYAISLFVSVAEGRTIDAATEAYVTIVG